MSGEVTSSEFHAGLAHPRSILANVGIGLIEGMSTMTARGTRLLRGLTVAVADILFVGHGRQVASPDTGLHFAKVGNFQPLGDAAVNETMRVNQLGSVPEVAVSRQATGANPEPAIAKGCMAFRKWPVLIDVPPETFLGRRDSVGAWHQITPFRIASLYQTGRG